MLTHACNSSIQEAEAGRVSQIQGWLGLENKTQATGKKAGEEAGRAGITVQVINKCLFLQNKTVFSHVQVHTHKYVYTHIRKIHLHKDKKSGYHLSNLGNIYTLKLCRF